MRTRRPHPSQSAATRVRGRLLTASRRLLLLASATLLALAGTGPAWAADKPQPSIYDYYAQNGVLWYSANAKACTAPSTSSPDDGTPGNGSGGVPGSSYSLGQVESFSGEPVSSTWDISDQTAESWFLKTKTAAIGKYGLDAGTIGAVTSAVKAAGVSPAFFYSYTVNEGGGAGGFINHYGDEASGGAAGNAARDAKYLADYSKATDGHPATGGGEPADMPTAEAQALIKALPAGSIGVVYIQATAATTAEVETLNGKTGDWTGKYGSPLEGVMGDVKAMGGDPLKGGASVSAASAGGSACSSSGGGDITVPTGQCNGGSQAASIATSLKSGSFDGKMDPAVVKLGNYLIGCFKGISSIGGLRTPDPPFNEHCTGRTLDIMITGDAKDKQDVEYGNEIAAYLTKNASTLKLFDIIWRAHDQWTNISPGDNGWKWYNAYGVPGVKADDNTSLSAITGQEAYWTQMHMNHIHMTVEGSSTNPGCPAGNGGNPVGNTTKTTYKDQGAGLSIEQMEQGQPGM